jgi:hypothetical protein
MNFGTTAITPEDFIGRIEDRVKAVCGLPEEDAFLSLAADDEHIAKPPKSKFVTIFPARFPPWQGVYSGSGETGFDAAIRTTVFCKLTNDQEHRASRILRDSKNGLLRTMFLPVAGLQGWTMPLDDDPDKSYLREPMRVVGSGPELVTKKTSANVWVLCWVMWEAKFTAILNPQATESPTLE